MVTEVEMCANIECCVVKLCLFSNRALKTLELDLVVIQSKILWYIWVSKMCHSPSFVIPFGLTMSYLDTVLIPSNPFWAWKIYYFLCSLILTQLILWIGAYLVYLILSRCTLLNLNIWFYPSVGDFFFLVNKPINVEKIIIQMLILMRRTRRRKDGEKRRMVM